MLDSLLGLARVLFAWAEPLKRGQVRKIRTRGNRGGNVHTSETQACVAWAPRSGVGLGVERPGDERLRWRRKVLFRHDRSKWGGCGTNERIHIRGDKQG